MVRQVTSAIRSELSFTLSLLSKNTEWARIIYTAEMVDGVVTLTFLSILSLNGCLRLRRRRRQPINCLTALWHCYMTCRTDLSWSQWQRKHLQIPENTKTDESVYIFSSVSNWQFNLDIRWKLIADCSLYKCVLGINHHSELSQSYTNWQLCVKCIQQIVRKVNSLSLFCWSRSHSFR